MGTSAWTFSRKYSLCKRACRLVDFAIEPLWSSGQKLSGNKIDLPRTPFNGNCPVDQYLIKFVARRGNNVLILQSATKTCWRLPFPLFRIDSRRQPPIENLSKLVKRQGPARRPPGGSQQSFFGRWPVWLHKYTNIQTWKCSRYQMIVLHLKEPVLSTSHVKSLIPIYVSANGQVRGIWWRSVAKGNEHTGILNPFPALWAAW